MPATKTKGPKAKKSAATRKPAARKPAARKPPATPSAIERTTELSEDMFKSLEDGAKSAIEAVRKFVETVDRTLPPQGVGLSRREEITDSALEMAERLVHTQYEFLRKVVDSASESMAGSRKTK